MNARRFADDRITVPMLVEYAIELADADAENEAAFCAARRRFWRMFRHAVEQRAQRIAARKVHRAKAGG